MKKIFYFLFLLFSYTQIQSQVIINEYSAANYDGINMPGATTDFEDWIELYNTSGSSFDLTGFYLTDKLDNLDKWQFPAGVTIGANDYLIVVASGENIVSGGLQHTNFKLTQTTGNEYVILSDQTATIVDSVRLNVSNQRNHSRGRTTNGAATWSIFETPTFDAANSGAKDGYAPMVQFNLAPGFYSGTQTVSLSTSLAGATIRYTTDGSEPTGGSTVYSAPISVPNTTVIKAKTFTTLPTLANGFTEVNTYFIDESHTVKVISVAGDDLDVLVGGTQIEPIGSFEIFDTDGTFMDEGYGDYNEHGNDSWAYDQRGLDWVTRDQLGVTNQIDADIFPTKSRGKFQRLILKCGASDNYPFENGGAHIRDPYVQMLSQLGDLRMDERTYVPAVMYVNGQYWGVYEIREKVDDHDFTDYYYDQDERNIEYLKTWGGTWQEYGEPNALPNWDDFVNYVLSNDMSIQANYDVAKGQYNTGSLIDYFILNGFIVNVDWLNWNTSWWRGLDPDGEKRKWRYSLWDMDAVFDHYVNFTGMPSSNPNSDPCDADDLGNVGGQGHVPIWNAFRENEEFFADYVNRYAELSSSVFTCDSMLGLLDNMIAAIEPEMPRHISRWGGTMAEWQANVQDIRDFINTRCVVIADEIVDCYEPEISGPYEVVVMIDPPLSGEVELHTITPSVYPHSATYFGGVNINIDADAFTGYIFDYWSIQNNAISPDVNTENASMQLSSNDTLIAHFILDNLEYDTITVLVEPVGAGQVDVDGTTITPLPFTQQYVTASNITFDANANAGFTFSNWELQNNTALPNTTTPNMLITSAANDTIIARFDPILLDTVTFVVSPVGAGNLVLDGVNIAAFPYTEIFNSGTTSNMETTENLGFTFNNWATNNNVINPNTTTTNVSVTWSDNDTVFINFDVVPIYDIVLEVEPAGAGTIDFNGTNVAAFPSTQQVSEGSNVDIVANSNVNFTFEFWQASNSSIQPNTNSATANFNANSNDTIVAYFSEYIEDTLVVLMFPENSAVLNVGNDVITSTPFEGYYEVGTILEVEAIPNTGNTFNQWELNTSSLPDYNEATYFVFTNQDTLIAYINAPVNVENLGEDFAFITVYPTVVNDMITIEYTLNEASNVQIDLLNINGQVVRTLDTFVKDNSVISNTLSYNLEIASGIYFVRFTSDKTFATQRIIKVD